MTINKTLLKAYCEELDKLREKYGYRFVAKGENGSEWQASARVPHIVRKRMVKLMGMIDILRAGRKSCLDQRFFDAPSWQRLWSLRDAKEVFADFKGSPSLWRVSATRHVQYRGSEE